MSRGYPSMTALLALLAIAGYQNRDKIAEWLAAAQRSPGSAAPAPQGGAGGSPPGKLGGLLAGTSIRQAGHGEVADSWVGHGPNKQISPSHLERIIGADVLETVAQQTGLSPEEILSRLSKNLPEAVDSYTPDGRIPTPADLSRPA